MKYALILLLGSSLHIFGEDAKPYLTDKLTLLPGYVIQQSKGIDSIPGIITKDNGLSIEYDIGDLAGNYLSDHSETADKYDFYYETVVQGAKVYVGMKKPNTLYVVYQEKKKWVNFYAEVKDRKDIAEMMTIALSYVPTKQ